MYALIKSLVLPPGGLILVLLSGLYWWRRPMLGRFLVFVASGLLLLLSLPLVSGVLMNGLDVYPALDPQRPQANGAQAIVVLAAGRIGETPEYGGDSVGPLTLQRIRYAAWLQRRTGLPLILTGGTERDDQRPMAELMRDTLEGEFGVPVAAIEGASRTTAENARFTAAILRSRGFDKVLLVSHGWHLPRAVDAFRLQGLQVTPAPTASVRRFAWDLDMTDFLPNARAFHMSYFAVHEYLGRIWYGLRTQYAADSG